MLRLPLCTDFAIDFCCIHLACALQMYSEAKTARFSSVAPIFVSLVRGALTDKLQKGDKAPPKGTRLEVGTQLKLPFASFPDFDELKNDEKFWSVRDVLEKIAKNRGKSDKIHRSLSLLCRRSSIFY